MSGWTTTTIGDQVTLQRGMDITREQQRPGRVPVVSSGGVSSVHDTAAAKGPGVVLGRKGVVGSVYYVAEDYWPHDTTLWVRDFKANFPRFVYYFFKHRARMLASLDVGSANPTLNRNHVHPTVVEWPPLSEQRAIARILGALDDKIELNRRTNETLEAMARALFQSWFVDFDPVRAKMEGRQPEGMDAETAKLFPFDLAERSFEDAGWAQRNWEDVACLEYGRALRTHGSSTGTVPVYGTVGRIGFHDTALWQGPGVIVGRKGAYRGVSFCSEPFFVIDTAFYLRPKVPLAMRWAYYELKRWDLNSTDSGSAIPSTSRDAFNSRAVKVPPLVLQHHFAQQMSAAWARVETLGVEASTLTALRDALLPKLLSGELRIPDAERAVSKVL